MTRVYDVSPLDVEAVADSITLARGRHLAESIGGCIGCHGDGLGGNRVEDLGPLGVIQAPNLTRGVGGVGNDYTDGELGRTVRHGIKRDGMTVLFMPSYEHNWWPDADIVAIVSYVRSIAPVDNEQPPTEVGLLGQILDPCVHDRCWLLILI